MLIEASEPPVANAYTRSTAVIAIRTPSNMFNIFFINAFDFLILSAVDYFLL